MKVVTTATTVVTVTLAQEEHAELVDLLRDLRLRCEQDGEPAIAERAELARNALLGRVTR